MDNQKKDKKELDEKVQHMIETWDIVTCRICKKKISMLNARLVDDKYFICKEH